MKFISLLIWGLLRGYAVHHIWSTTSRCEWCLNHHLFEFVCATKKSANFKHDAWRPFFNQKKLRSLQGLSTSAVVFYTKMDSDSPKHRWVTILWTHTPTGFVKLIIILVVFVALGSNSGKQPYPVCSCLKTSWSATWRTDFGPFWLWQGVPSCVESYLVSSAAPAITPLSAQFSFTCHARHGLYGGVVKGHTLWKTPHSNKIIGTNEKSARNLSCRMQWLFKRRCRRTVLESTFETSFITWKECSVATWKFRSPPKNLLGIRWCFLPVMTGVPVGKWKPDHPIKSSFHLRRWRNQKIPWLQWWRSDNNWRRQNSLKKHLKHLEFLPNLTEKLSPWIDSCSVSVRFGSITGPWKWCNQNPWVFLLDPGSPKEGPGLWRRWGRSVFKRFPHRLTKLWNTMVWSHCFWLETHKKPGKRMGNTLQWLNWQTSVFWTFNCQQTGEPPSENFWGFLFCESFSIPGEDRQGVETGDPKDLSVPRQGDQPSNNLIGFPQCSLRANELLEKWRNLGFANDLD